MASSDQIVVLSESRLKALLEHSAESITRRFLREVGDPAAAGRPGFNFVTNEQAMEALGWSRATLARRRADGTLPYSKVGSSVYYRREDIEALVESNRVKRD